ncbi:MAG: AAA family ATPase [Candidatus Riflebacteria bacterium]|nr:AAA family ATPase [Candidatus Riflebacteria bacterium]
MKLFRRSVLPLGSCRFRPGTVLAQSTHSLVIRGHCLQAGQPVILKTIPLEARTPARLAGFERESGHLAAVAAIPGVVQCLLRQPRGPIPAIVFRDPGASAWHLHLQGPRLARLPLPQRLRLLARLAGILHRVHQAGLVHRDVTPANVVWLPGRDLLELIDFSLAGPPRPAPRRASPNLEGTLAYLAPEQTGRLHLAQDHRLDLYSFGLTGFEILTGVHPFAGLAAEELIHAHLAVIPPALSATGLPVPDEGEELFARLLAKDPADRPPDAGVVAAALADLADRLAATPVASRGGHRVGKGATATTAAGTSRAVAPTRRSPLPTVGRLAGAARSAPDRKAPDRPTAIRRTTTTPATTRSEAVRPTATRPTTVRPTPARSGAPRSAGNGVSRAPSTKRRAAPPPSMAPRTTAARSAASPPPAAKTPVRARLRAPDLATPLVGRQRETAWLCRKLQPGSGPPARAVIIAGVSGIGKSALAHQFLAGLGAAPDRPWLATAKGERDGQQGPLGTLRALFQQVARFGLSEPPASRSRLAKGLQASATADWQALALLDPDLVRLGGKSPAEVRSTSTDQELALRLSLAAFSETLGRTGRRVFLLVDDLPWTDAPSRRLLEFLLSKQGDQGPFTLLATWRTGADGEPPERLVAQVMGWRALGVPVECLDLAPLPAKAIGELVQSLVSRPLPPSRLAREATRLQRLTGGNPLGLAQVLRSLALVPGFDPTAPATAWQEAIGRAGGLAISGSLPDLLASRLVGQTPEVRRWLHRAACLGHQFEADLLARAAGVPPGTVAKAMESATGAGLVVPTEATAPLPPPVRWRFAHDQVRTVCLGLFPQAEANAWRARLARAVAAVAPDPPDDASLLRLATLIEPVARTIPDPDECWQAVTWLGAGGWLASLIPDFETAQRWLDLACDLGEALRPTGSRRPILRRFQEERMRILFLAGNFPAGEREFERLCADDRSSPGFLQLVTRKAHGLRHDPKRLPEVIDQCLNALGASLGELPGAADLPSILPPLQEAAFARLETMSPGDILTMPVSEDRETTALSRLLEILQEATYHCQSPWNPWVIVQGVRLLLDRGVVPGVSNHLATLGMAAVQQERYDRIRWLVPLARAFQAHPAEKGDKTWGDLLLGAYLLPWIQPLPDCLACLARARLGDPREREMSIAKYSLVHEFPMMVTMGRPWPELARLAQASHTTARVLLSFPIEALFVSFQALCRCMLGETSAPWSLSDATFDHEAWFGTFRGNPLEPLFGKAFVWLLRVNLLFDRIPQAVELLERIEDRLLFSLGMSIELGEYHTMAALIRLRQAGEEGAPPGEGGTVQLPHQPARNAGTPPADEAENPLDVRDTGLSRRQPARPRGPSDLVPVGPEVPARVAAHAGFLERAATSAPFTFRHKSLLVQAHLARRAGRTDDWLGMMTEAIDLAQQGGFSPDAALAHELLGRWWLARGNTGYGQLHLRRAFEFHSLLEARPQVDRLRHEFPHLFLGLSSSGDGRASPAATIHAGAELSLPALTLDAGFVLTASRALAAEFRPAPLQRLLLRLMLQSAGAQRASLVQEMDDPLAEREPGVARRPPRRQGGTRSGVVSVGPPTSGWSLLATAETAAGGIVFPRGQTGRRTDAGSADRLPIGPLRFVRETGHPLLVRDAQAEPPWNQDPCLRRRGTRALLVLPLANQSRVVGYVLLEHGTQPGAFTTHHLDPLAILGAQAAGQLVQARNRRDLQQANRALRAEMQDRIRAQHELAAAERFRRTLVDSLEDIVGATDAAGRVTFLSPAGFEAFPGWQTPRGSPPTGEAMLQGQGHEDGTRSSGDRERRRKTGQREPTGRGPATGGPAGGPGKVTPDGAIGPLASRARGVERPQPGRQGGPCAMRETRVSRRHPWRHRGTSDLVSVGMADIVPAGPARDLAVGFAADPLPVLLGGSASEVADWPWRNVERHVETPGGRRVLLVSTRPLGRAGAGWVFTLHDITQRRVLEGELLQATEREQQRVGRELHDGLCQDLVGSKHLAYLLREQLQATVPALAETAGHLHQALDRSLEQTRALSHDLSLYSDRLSLGQHLERLAGHLRQAWRVRVTVRARGTPPVFTPTEILHLFRIAQEAAGNALRHGGATALSFTLARAHGKRTLTITNDGRPWADRDQAPDSADLPAALPGNRPAPPRGIPPAQIPEPAPIGARRGGGRRQEPPEAKSCGTPRVGADGGAASSRPADPRPGIGLRTMEYRANLLNGRLHLRRGRPVTVTVTLPPL